LHQSAKVATEFKEESIMKLCRYGQIGKEKPGLVDAAGKLRDLSGVVSDITPDVLAPKSLAKLARIKTDTLPLVRGAKRYGVPVSGVGKFIGIGLNYSDHAAEANMPLPKEPIVFTKAISCLQGANDPVMLPKRSEKTDWEAELGVVIGSQARYVTKKDALSYVAGYCVVNDLSEREYQLERGSQWDKGKGCDGFGPVGPWLVTGDEIGDPQKLAVWLELNGQRMQNGSTRRMIFNVAHLVSYVSGFMTLMPGDIITTGTPPGVGMARKPPRFLQAGDELRLGVEGLGEQCQRVVKYRS
jgi:2-keto-4-pentenoate hydratase/2-oxohepta-3-ene-1,7-dioic acid hydratase in catechol pathway